jgi:hypothetical protein
MKINGYKKEFIKVVTYRVEDVPNTGTVIYSKHYDDFDKVIEKFFKTEDGYDVNSPSIREKIEEFIDKELKDRVVLD